MSPTTGSLASPTTAAAQQGAPVGVRAVVCYTRTANPGTVGQRHLRRQRAKLEAEVAVHGWAVVAWVEDLHQCGTTLQRPGLREALALLADHQADALLATDAAPLAVDTAATSQLAALAGQQGWQVLTVTPTRITTVAPDGTVVDPSRGRGGARR